MREIFKIVRLRRKQRERKQIMRERRLSATNTSAARGNKTATTNIEKKKTKKKTSLSSSVSFSQLVCSPEEALNEKNITLTTTTGKNNNDGFGTILNGIGPSRSVCREEY